MGKKISFIATGDSFMTRRIPSEGYPGFQEIAQVIQQHDVRFNNLEITIHNQQGYPSAVSGGTWAMAEPEILDDLNRYGFNLYNTANNHSCDYSCGGTVATIENLNRCGKVYAGTGATLDEAAAPGYLDVNGVRVALLGACSTCDVSAIAGNRNSSVIGRPGLNPLRYVNTYHVEQKYFDMLDEEKAGIFTVEMLGKIVADTDEYDRDMQNTSMVIIPCRRASCPWEKPPSCSAFTTECPRSLWKRICAEWRKISARQKNRPIMCS